MAVLKLVQNDTAPSLFFTVRNAQGAPVSLQGATALLHFRAVGETTVKESLVCEPVPGLEIDDGAGGFDVDTSPPYDQPGAGGRLQMDWGPNTLDTVGDFEGELEVTFANGRQQTVYNLFTFTVREQFA